MASLSTCHLELVVWDGNLVKSCLPKQICISFCVDLTFACENAPSATCVLHGMLKGNQHIHNNDIENTNDADGLTAAATVRVSLRRTATHGNVQTGMHCPPIIFN